MAVFAFERVTLAFEEAPLLDAVTLQVEAGERLALVGRNGSGKSTVLALLAGALQPDAGSIYRDRTLRLAYVPQEPPFVEDDTVVQAVTRALGTVGAEVAAYQRIAACLSRAEGAEAQRLLGQLHAVQSRLEHGDGWRLHTQVETILSRLCLQAQAPVRELSSGWQRRVALAQALAVEPELLLLDEPTNHLDLDTIEWLERHLLNFHGTLLFVTHDRVFLERVATGILELDRGTLRRFPGTWSAYQTQKQALLANEDTQAAQFDKYLAQEEAWVRQGVRARRTRNEGRVRRLLAMREERRVRREVPGQVTFTLDSGERSGQMVVEVDNIAKAFGDLVVLDTFSTRIMRGDRIGLIGPNGIGKTTFLRLLLGELPPDTGSVRRGSKVSVAYFDQRREQLDPEATLWETLCPHGGDHVLVGGERRHVVGYLAEFLFAPPRLQAPVKTLSGGERNRLLLARLFTRPANVLVLDEPTNDLDMETLELLEGLLIDYPGTLLVASHDRAFLDGVVTSVYAFAGRGRVREYVGGYSDWLRARHARPTATARPRRVAVAATSPPPRQRLTYREQRELEALPSTIETLEATQAALHAQLDDAGLFQRAPETFHQIMQRLPTLAAEIQAAYGRWEELEGRK